MPGTQLSLNQCIFYIMQKAEGLSPRQVLPLFKHMVFLFCFFSMVFRNIYDEEEISEIGRLEYQKDTMIVHYLVLLPAFFF